ncbi:MAG TPA: benzoyl-CoA 2,3-epoxidase subunit BoxB [Dehalococcoidia bacterium]|nr:benzoyl-CoA 2,3-epoxidase subunit BoxB [Dehalococcoidia bacterium]
MADLSTIPNNVDLESDSRLQHALHSWQPNFLKWWMEIGPQGWQAHDVYLRTAVKVDPSGWARFEYVKMPEYRWGIFLVPESGERQIGFGDYAGRPAWDEVPGEHRNALRRIIITQGDTEPASVEQQARLGSIAPSLYDLRNLFQVNVEEGRHLWAMVYLLHRYFGRDGREEAEQLLARRSGDVDKPRILSTFNEPIETWLDFFMFTMFTDRDGKYQLASQAESGFSPLARTTRFMLTEEAHHMFVGESGVDRVVQRAAELMATGTEPRTAGAVDLVTIQKYINHWYSLSLDLFGGEVSSNAADYFAAGLKGRYREADQYSDHHALEETHRLSMVEDGQLIDQEVPLRNAMNAVLQEAYIRDCQRGVERWNKTIAGHGLSGIKLRLPSKRFNRRVGTYAGLLRFDPAGAVIGQAKWELQRDEWLPTAADQAYVRSIMRPVYEPGKVAAWIAPPAKGINGKPLDFEYVRIV